MAQIAKSPPKHDYRWAYKLDLVTVTCKTCDVTVTFDHRAEFAKCIAWCNEHQIPQEAREAVSSETTRRLQTVLVVKERSGERDRSFDPTTPKLTSSKPKRKD
jgi:hypothetical protein